MVLPNCRRFRALPQHAFISVHAVTCENKPPAKLITHWFLLALFVCPVRAPRTRLQGTLYAGNLLKRGSAKTSHFKDRWVTLSREELAYGVKEGERPLGTVAMREVVGLAAGIARPRSFSTSSSHVSGAGGRRPAAGETWHCDRHRNMLLWRTGPAGSHTRRERQRAEEVDLGREEFAVCCSFDGLHKGRMYVFKCSDLATRERWIELLSRAITFHSRNPLVTASALQVSGSRETIQSTYKMKRLLLKTQMT